MLTAASRAADFPSLARRAYLNTGAEGIPPRAVIDALRQYGEDKLLGMDGRERHAARWDAARAALGRLIGLDADEVTLCSCSSEAYNLARAALALSDGDEVVINDLDFPAGATQFLLAGSPASTRVWRSRTDGALHLDDLAPLLSRRTRLVQVSLVSFLNGFRVSLPSVARVVRANSPAALIGVDVTQAMGRVSMDLRDADLIVSSTHKWLLATHGGGVVGVPRRSAATLTVPAGGWFNLRDAFADDRFDRPAEPRAGAAGFTVGMPNYPAVYAAAAGAEYILSIGVDAIERRADPLVARVHAALVELGQCPMAPADALAGIVAFRHPRADALHAFLRARDIHVMHNAGRLRVSVHGYNTTDDIDRLIVALTEGWRDVG